MLSLPLKLVAAKSRVITFLANLSAFTALTAFLLFNLSSCDDKGVEPRDIPLPPLPDDAAIFVSMDDAAGLGMLILNANALEPIDSMYTTPGVPFSIEFSPDNNTWYSTWGRYANYSLYSGSVYPLGISNSVPLIYAKGFLAQSPDRRYLIAYGHKGIDVFDRQTLTLLYQDTTLLTETYSGIKFSKTKNLIYSIWIENKQTIGLVIYDIDQGKILDTLRLFNKTNHSDLQDSDLVISHDDKYAFLSAWNWRGLSGFGSFFIIDLLNRAIINEYPAGAFAQLGLSPDGKYVYLSDPSGYLYMLPGLNKVFRYEIASKKMETFLNLSGTDKFAFADDNRTIFISAWIQFKTPEGKDASIVKIDALTKRITGYYTIPKDSLGYFSRLMRSIKLGKYPQNLKK